MSIVVVRDRRLIVCDAVNRSFAHSIDDDGVSHLSLSWLPDGYYIILRSYVFGPSGIWTMAPLRYTAKFDPFLSLDCTRVEGKGALSNLAIWQH